MAVGVSQKQIAYVPGKRRMTSAAGEVSPITDEILSTIEEADVPEIDTFTL